MTVSAERDLHYDPYDVDLNADSYPMFRRLREEAPLYYTRLMTSTPRAGSRMSTMVADNGTWLISLDPV